jgi:hypothetical protein
MRKLQKFDDKFKRVNALLDLFRSGHLSDDVYVISKERPSAETTGGVILWISSFDFYNLLRLAHGSRVSVLEVESNTLSVRKSGEAPEGTERFKYVSVS